jgi:hypothetical protein
LRLSTASTRRAIDGWKGRASVRVKTSWAWAIVLTAQLLISERRERLALLPALVFALSLNFALAELAILIVVGFYVAKLQCYRFVNMMLGFLRILH